MDDVPPAEVEGWLLSGGEGRRMGGQDKGLVDWHGQPLALATARRLAPQVRALALNVNRNAATYAAWGWPVVPDAADLSAGSGPLAGILTGLRALRSAWLQLAPCDTPLLPEDLVARLQVSAMAEGAQVAVPITHDAVTGEKRHHWTCALVHRSTLDGLDAAFGLGERRVGGWVRQTRWIGVCFDGPAAFTNINTPETLHGTPAA